MQNVHRGRANRGRLWMRRDWHSIPAGAEGSGPSIRLGQGLLNNVERPPVCSRDNRELFAGRALPHFNEVDECAGLDALLTNRIWNKLGYDPETTLHDVRYGEKYQDEFVWVF